MEVQPLFTNYDKYLYIYVSENVILTIRHITKLVNVDTMLSSRLKTI